MRGSSCTRRSGSRPATSGRSATRSSSARRTIGGSASTSCRARENLSATDLQDPTVVERLGLKCPVDGGPLSPPRRFNLMFKTHMGPVEEDAAVVYLRPETAQGSYVNFKNVQQSSRKKVPFGIAQIGKSFRNEISPGNFVFRMREFEQMEMQYFVHPDRAADIFEEWLPRRWDWYTRYGVTESRLRFREHAPDELAHYAKKAVDVEYRFPFGWKELEGIHNRGDFDLSRHQAESGENLEYFDPATEQHFIPWIVETAGGPDRSAFTFLIDAYREEEVRGEKRVVLGLHPELAPYKVAVLPLLKKRPEIVELAPEAPRRPRAGRHGRLRRHRRDRQALPAPGRDRHAVVRHGRRRVARGRRGDDPRSRRDDPGARPGRRRQARRSSTGSPRRAGSAKPMTSAAREVTAAVRAWLDGLDDAQRAQATFPFETPERFVWAYTPGPRKGLAIRDMRPDQRAASTAILASAMSPRTAGEVAAIIALETVLGQLEQAGGRAGWTRRDPELYWFAVFGDPGSAAPWSWRIGGHHIAIHVTVADDRVIGTTPSFLGANPAVIPSGPRAGEQDAARGGGARARPAVGADADGARASPWSTTSLRPTSSPGSAVSRTLRSVPVGDPPRRSRRAASGGPRTPDPPLHRARRGRRSPSRRGSGSSPPASAT